MNQPINYRKLRKQSDIEIAKEKLRYSLLLREEMVYNSVDSLRRNFYSSLKETAWRWGMKLTAGFVLNQVRFLKGKRR